MRAMFSASLVMSVALVLGACASTPEPTSSAAAAKPAASAKAQPETLTGSRFAKTTNDRNVRSIGNPEAREDMSSVRSLGNDVGARGN